MENKNNFTGIIIPVIIAVILLTVLPIINSMNVECPPCEECPSYSIGNIEINPDFSSGDYIVDKGSYDYIDSATIIKDIDLIPENIKKDVNIFGVVGTYEETGGSGTYEYVLPVTVDDVDYDEFININLTILFGLKNSQTIINDTPYYSHKSTIFINYRLADTMGMSDFPISTTQDYYYLYWENFTDNALTIQAPFNPIDYECLGIFYATPNSSLEITLSFNNKFAYKYDKVTSTPIENGDIFRLPNYEMLFHHPLQGITGSVISFTGNYYYLPKLGTQELYIEYGE